MNPQALISIPILLLVLYWLCKQFKQLLIETINGYSIHHLPGVYEVRKDKEAKAQFITHKSAVLYCNTH